MWKFQYTTIRAIASTLLKNSVYFTQKNILFSILHYHFYKTPTSVYLLYTIFSINNIFMSWRERERVSGRKNVRKEK